MDRRDFIKSGALLSLPFILKSCDWITNPSPYQIIVDSDATTGHLIRKQASMASGLSFDVKTVIVGGGIAGISAAHSLGHKDYLLFELSSELGGSSSSSSHENSVFAQGAHYDLSYPSYYGEEVLELFQKLDIIDYHPWSDSWGFKDREHIIFPRSKSQGYDFGQFREDVLKEGPIKAKFEQIIDFYQGKTPLPTRKTDVSLHELNQVPFDQFLSQKIAADADFIRQMDYHMKDDYGAPASHVSALAGLHYFTCRPYYNQIVELFSPPQGNYYFIEKMMKNLIPDQIKRQHLVSQIQPKHKGKGQNKGFELSVIDAKNETIHAVSCEQVIYAGQKHALKFIYPDLFPLFENNSYAPWMVINVIVHDELPTPAFWQNEMLTEDTSFLGFIDSAAQHRPDKKTRILTCYYCLPASSRADLLNVKPNQDIITEKTIQYLSQYFKMDLTPLVKQVHIKVMGHAMPIPKPGYLLNDKNQYIKDQNITFAGVDNGRLPLLYEAVDSGITAAKQLK